jgi:hypothetical protein
MGGAYSDDLGDDAPNFVEVGNNPDQSSPWVTNYAAPTPTSTITFGPLTIKPAKPKAKASTAAAPKASATGKVALKRTGAAGSILDKILPLMVDAAGKQTIFGLPPALVYVAGGILSASLVAFLMKLLRGGVGRVSNPKRARTSRRQKR